MTGAWARARSVVLAGVLAWGWSAREAGLRAETPPSSSASCVTFVGDVGLSRGVARELAQRHASPWASLLAAGPAGLSSTWVGNFEGAVRPSSSRACTKPEGPCLPVEPEALAWLRGSPFRALSLANNHADDFGPEGRAATRAGLATQGIAVIEEDEPSAPLRLEVGGTTWAFIGVDLVGNSARDRQLALERARLAIGRARAETPLVAVLPHWGREGKSFVAPEQERWARLFAAWGATVIVGSHAHVIQPARCDPGVATYFGLGNHLFDQTGAAARAGLAVTCCPTPEGLRCTSVETERSPTSAWPTLRTGSPSVSATAPCDLALPPTDRRWLAHPGHARFTFVQPFPPAGPDAFFALRRHPSSFDGEDALRPYVFRVQGRAGPIVDVWRGTALARPLVAARLFTFRDQELLCVLHRGDTFLARAPQTTARVSLVYRWTGFGFKGLDDEDARDACAEL